MAWSCDVQGDCRRTSVGLVVALCTWVLAIGWGNYTDKSLHLLFFDLLLVFLWVVGRIDG